MKVGKEELLGLLAAVEWSLSLDEPALLAAYEDTVSFWLDGLRDLPGVEVERGYPSEAGQPHSRALLRIAPSARDDLVEALWRRDPRIAVGLVGDDAIALNPQTVEPGEAAQVLDALRTLLCHGFGEVSSGISRCQTPQTGQARQEIGCPGGDRLLNC